MYKVTTVKQSIEQSLLKTKRASKREAALPKKERKSLKSNVTIVDLLNKIILDRKLTNRLAELKAQIEPTDELLVEDNCNFQIKQVVDNTKETEVIKYEEEPLFLERLNLQSYLRTIYKKLQVREGLKLEYDVFKQVMRLYNNKLVDEAMTGTPVIVPEDLGFLKTYKYTKSRNIAYIDARAKSTEKPTVPIMVLEPIKKHSVSKFYKFCLARTIVRHDNTNPLRRRYKTLVEVFNSGVYNYEDLQLANLEAREQLRKKKDEI